MFSWFSQWVSAREKFQQAANLMDAEQRMKKSMWGQFWSAHQRFFKYLCIASKVRRVVQLAREEVQNGKVGLMLKYDKIWGCRFYLIEISVCGRPSCTHVLGFLNVLSQTIPETIHCLSVSLLKIVTSCFLCSVWWSVFSPLEKQEHWRLWRKEEESSMTLCRLQSTYRLQMISLTPSLSCL